MDPLCLVALINSFRIACLLKGKTWLDIFGERKVNKLMIVIKIRAKKDRSLLISLKML